MREWEEKRRKIEFGLDDIPAAFDFFFSPNCRLLCSESHETSSFLIFGFVVRRVANTFRKQTEYQSCKSTIIILSRMSCFWTNGGYWSSIVCAGRIQIRPNRINKYRISKDNMRQLHRIRHDKIPFAEHNNPSARFSLSYMNSSLRLFEGTLSVVYVDVTAYENIVHCLCWCFRNMRQRSAQTRDNHLHHHKYFRVAATAAACAMTRIPSPFRYENNCI